MFGIVVHAFIYTIFQVQLVSGDYQCLCNYNVEIPVYSTASSSGHVIGYLYEFDCKPLYVKVAKGATFQQIQYEKQVGYTENGPGILIQVCKGHIPDEDLVKASTTITTAAMTKTTQHIQTKPTTLPGVTDLLPKTVTDTSTRLTTSFVQNMTSQLPSTSTMFTQDIKSSSPPSQGLTNPLSNFTLQSSASTQPSTDSSIYNVTNTLLVQSISTASTTATTTTTVVMATTRSTPSSTRTPTSAHSMGSTSTTAPTTTRGVTPSPSTRRSTTALPSTTRSSTSTLPSTTVSTKPQTSAQPSTTPTTTKPSTSAQQSTTPTTTKTTTSAPKPSCQHGWIMHGSSCYLFQTNSQKKWSDANNDCASKRSHLAITETKDEFKFLKQQLVNRIDVHDHSDSAWLAGRDVNNEGTWEWYDGFTDTYRQFTYTHWGVHEPDAGDGDHEEDCMTMANIHDFKWADYSCGEKMYYICEQSALAQAVNPPKQTSGQICPDGWVMNHGTCYFFHTSGRSSWSGANSDCASKKSHLAAIETETEFNFLKLQLDQRIDSSIHDDSDTSAWIAGRDNNHEGHWEWYDGFSRNYKPITYDNWGHSEPNSDHGHSDEDCMAMVAHKSYKWADYDCDVKMFYVCEQLLATLMNTQTQTPPKHTNGAYCSPGWIQNHGSCYLFHTSSRYSWDDANSFCKARHAHLAIIETAEEDNFLKQESSQKYDLHHDSSSGVWVAGSDDDREGRWIWIDGFSHTSKPIGYSNWHPGEPDSGNLQMCTVKNAGSGDHDEDCMCLIGHKNFEWQDYSCGKHMYFICEKSTTFAAPLVG